jgi:DNA (cytosine-5)-methyltransferase 1
LESRNVPKHDVLVAGFPCQPYSIAGLRKGLKDERGTVFMEILRILGDKKPKAFLLENVKGIMAHDKGATFKYMVSLLEELGYNLRFQVLTAWSTQMCLRTVNEFLSWVSATRRQPQHLFSPRKLN